MQSRTVDDEVRARQPDRWIPQAARLRERFDDVRHEAIEFVGPLEHRVVAHVRHEHGVEIRRCFPDLRDVGGIEVAVDGAQRDREAGADAAGT